MPPRVRLSTPDHPLFSPPFERAKSLTGSLGPLPGNRRQARRKAISCSTRVEQFENCLLSRRKRPSNRIICESPRQDDLGKVYEMEHYSRLEGNLTVCLHCMCIRSGSAMFVSDFLFCKEVESPGM